MAKGEKVTLTNMCMIEDAHGNVLVQDKKSSSWGGICFPGGHVEEGEPFTISVIREVKEETGPGSSQSITPACRRPGKAMVQCTMLRSEWRTKTL